MDNHNEVTSVSTASPRPNQAVSGAKAHMGTTEAGSRKARVKLRGQSAVFIALAMFVIIGIVGLAIDGGAMLNSRREAQNAVDGASLAGAKLMLEGYEAMALASPVDIPGTEGEENAIRSRIESYAAVNGVITSTIEAYFVNRDKQVVTSHSGVGGCGLANPCQVGDNRMVPWHMGATGITVRGRSQTNSFFMSVFGFNSLGATASTVGYMGVAIDSPPDLAVTPIGFFTQTQYLNTLQPGWTYTLIDGDTRYGSGNNGWVDFNGQAADANRTRALLNCGYNPSLRTQAQWDQWCPAESGTTGLTGPTKYWTGWTEPTTGPLYDYRMQWGLGATGWWLPGSTGQPRSNCQDLADFVARTPGEFVVPIFDAQADEGGANQKFHLVSLASFRIYGSTVDCHARDDTTQPPTNYQHWHINGEFQHIYAAGSNGRHGNLRSSSLHVVFLQP